MCNLCGILLSALLASVVGMCSGEYDRNRDEKRMENPYGGFMNFLFPNMHRNSTLYPPQTWGESTTQNTTQNETLKQADEIKAILKKLLPNHDFKPNDSALDEIIYKNYFSLPFSEKSVLQYAIEGNTTSPVPEDTSTTTDTTTTTTTVSTTTTPLPPPPIDLESIFREIEELTYDENSDLIKKLNKSLHKKYTWGPKPICKTKDDVNNTSVTEPMTVTEVTTVELIPDYDDLESDEELYNISDTELIARCYVCGIHKEPGTPRLYIPRDTRCGDAFATDFLPMVPVDASARGHLARFRKNCHYLDVKNFVIPEKDPKTVLGRWTGGCSVRWTDLSGVYTERTCRNKIYPVKGHHLASKRMARLEMALKDTDNGCIVSPSASLLPLSRAISLYARFYACVCMGDFCNSVQSFNPTIFIIIGPVFTVLFNHV